MIKGAQECRHDVPERNFHRMNLFAVASLSTAVSCSVMALMSALFGRKEIHRILFAFNCSCALWGAGSFLAGIAVTEEAALRGWKIAHLGGVFITVIFYHLTTTLADAKNRNTLSFGYAQAVLFVLLATGTAHVFSSMRHVFGIHYPEAGAVYSLFVAIFIIYLCLSYYRLINMSRQARGYRRTQVLYITYGFLFGFLGGTSTILPAFHIDFLYPSGNFGVTLYCFVVTYAILRYRLMDFHIVLKKSLVYSFLAALLTGMYVVLIFVLTDYISEVADLTSFTVAVVFALLIAFLFAPLKKRIQLLVDRLFYKTSYDYYATVQNMSRELAGTIELRNTYRLIIDTLCNTLKLRSASILADQGEYFAGVYAKNGALNIPRNVSAGVLRTRAGEGVSDPGGLSRHAALDRDSELARLAGKVPLIIREELPLLADPVHAEAVSGDMELCRGEVVIPIRIEDRLSFMIVLGEKLSGDPFSSEDINLINTVGSQSAIALKNAMLYNELEKRIEARTAELSRANADLQREVAERRRAEEALKETYGELELRVRERTADLTEAVRLLNLEITERMRIEGELSKTAEEWSTTFDSTTDVVVLTDSGGRVVRTNRAGRNFFNCAGDEGKGRTVSQLFQNIGMTWDVPPLSAVVSSKRHEEGEIYFPDKDLWIVLTADPILEEQGGMTGAVVIIRDITDRRKAEDEKASLEGQLIQAQKMDSIGRLAGGVAHDFNNMLSAIIGYSYLGMLHLPAGSPVREHLKNIRITSERAAALTHQLLAFSRKQVLEMRDVNLTECVRNMEKMLSRLIGENILIEIRPSGELRTVRADPVQIEQVLMNLALNARDAMPRGGRMTIETADVSVREQVDVFGTDIPPGVYAMISVTDTGQGMSGEVREKIFEPFFTTKELGKGTGLGLATVYGIVKQHKGFISVESTPGRGSTFRIYFPKTAGEKTTALTGDQEEERVIGGSETILVVDDEPMILRVIEATLRPLGYRILSASRGEEALRLCDTFNGDIDLLLTDVIMPGISGRDLGRRFLEKKRSSKVIFMSGYTDDMMASQGVPDPGILFLQKPVIPAILIRKIRDVLDQRQR